MKDPIKRMKEIVQMLNSTSSTYYNTGEEMLSDVEYDSLEEELKRLEQETNTVFSNSRTVTVGAPVLDKIEDKEHDHLMLSLDKCHSSEEVLKFANGKELIAMTKLDGLSVSIRYENGKFVSAETRGDGYKGSDVTDHVKNFINVPLTINHDGVYVTDGEAIITYENFNKINKDGEYKNPRNLASGTLAQLDTSVVKERCMEFLVWDVIEGTKHDKLSCILIEAQELGFDTCDFIVVEPKIDIISGSNEWVLENAKNESLPCDGVVYKFNSKSYGATLGHTSHHFNNGIALKPRAEVYTTTLRDVIWDVSKTGMINPVAVFDEVLLDGEAATTRCTLHNVTYIKIHELGYDDEIEIKRANGVIPKLVGNRTRSNTIKIPTICPCCGSPTYIKKDNESEVLMCSNEFCDGVLQGSIETFCSRDRLDIHGMSEATIKFLIDRGWVKNYIDIYHLGDYKKQWMNYDGFGKSSVDKLLKAIEDSRHTTLNRVIAGLNIPLIGRSQSKTIAEYFKYNPDNFLLALNASALGNWDWTKLEGFGDEKHNSLVSFAKKHFDDDFLIELFDEFNFTIPEEKTTSSNNLADKTFMITGSIEKFKNRKEIEDVIKTNGGKVLSSVTNKLNYLICNDLNSTSSKMKKAKELGINIISEQQFLDMLGE